MIDDILIINISLLHDNIYNISLCDNNYNISSIFHYIQEIQAQLDGWEVSNV